MTSQTKLRQTAPRGGITRASNSGIEDRAPKQGLIGLLRAVCVTVSNSILQFPIMFELQQKALNQPSLLRNEVASEVDLMRLDGQDFLILDYGCGSGTYSGLVKPENYLGIDCNRAMLQRASDQHKDHRFVLASDLEGLQAELNEISHLLLVGVVHYLSEASVDKIFQGLPKNRPIKVLAIDTLKCKSGFGWLLQLFERGDFLRFESDHLRLLGKYTEQLSYKKVPYGNSFELAVYRGLIRVD